MAKTLSELFSTHLPKFKEEIVDTNSPNQVHEVSRTFLTQVFDNYSENTAMGLFERRIYPFVRDLSFASVALLPSCSIASHPKPEPVNGFFSATTKDPLSLILNLAPPIILTVAFIFSADIIIILLGIIWILTTVINQRRRHDPPHPDIAEYRVNEELLISALRDIVTDADRMMKEARDISGQLEAKNEDFWNDHPEILDLLHDFTEALETNDTELAMVKMKNIPTLLKTNGFALKKFDGDNSTLFEFFSSHDPSLTNTSTVRPALLKNNDLIRRGTVIKPNK